MIRSAGIFLCLSLLFLIFTLGHVGSTTAPGSANTARPEGVQSQQTEGSIAESARRQIEALLAEKQSRSPLQQKIDSQLLYALKISRGENLATNVRTLTV